GEGSRMFINLLRAASRRVRTGVVLGALIASAGVAFAQAHYPSQPIRLVVGVAPGGTTHMLARHVSAVQHLIALAKAKPGEVLYATAGKGTATHLAAELFNEAAGVKMTPV